LKNTLCPVAPPDDTLILSRLYAPEIVAPVVVETPFTKSVGADGDRVPDRSDHVPGPLYEPIV
jgi:hypothetical protein